MSTQLASESPPSTVAWGNALARRGSAKLGGPASGLWLGASALAVVAMLALFVQVLNTQMLRGEELRLKQRAGTWFGANGKSKLPAGGERQQAIAADPSMPVSTRMTAAVASN